MLLLLASSLTFIPLVLESYEFEPKNRKKQEIYQYISLTYKYTAEHKIFVIILFAYFSDKPKHCWRKEEKKEEITMLWIFKSAYVMQVLICVQDCGT